MATPGEAFAVRTAETLDRVDTLDAAVASIVERAWSRLFSKLASKPSAAVVATALRRIYPEIVAEIGEAFAALATWGWWSGVGAWADALPDAALPYLLALRGTNGKLVEAVIPSSPGQLPLFTGADDKANLYITLFPPPTRAEVDAVIYAPNRVDKTDWRSRLDRWSKKISDKDALADTLAARYADGGNLDDLARAVRPFVQNIGSTARRIARTEGMRIATAMSEKVNDQLGDLIQGYQRHATLDDVTRPEHAALHGRTYDRDDSSRPELPDEPNCRCWYEPILASDPAIEELKNTGTPPGPRDGTPEQQEAFAAWFDDQPPARQRVVVGAQKWGGVPKGGDGGATWAGVTGGGGTTPVPGTAAGVVYGPANGAGVNRNTPRRLPLKPPPNTGPVAYPVPVRPVRLPPPPIKVVRPPKPPPPIKVIHPPKFADVVIDTADMVKVGGKQGSNAAGTYRAKDGTLWYVKAADASHAENEVLANQLYRTAGVDVPELRFGKLDGKNAVASRIVPGLAKGSAEQLHKAGAWEDFAADAWLANWDAVGMGNDNMQLRGGKVIRIDAGGALMYRAQGGPKGSQFGNVATEVQSLRNPLLNKDSAAVFTQMSDAQLDTSYAKLLSKVNDDTIKQTLLRVFPGDANQDKRNEWQFKLSNRLASIEVAKKLNVEAIAKAQDAVLAANEKKAKLSAQGKAMAAAKKEKAEAFVGPPMKKTRAGPKTIPVPGPRMTASQIIGKPKMISEKIREGKEYWDGGVDRQAALRNFVKGDYKAMKKIQEGLAYGDDTECKRNPSLCAHAKRLLKATKDAPKAEGLYVRAMNLGPAGIKALRTDGNVTTWVESSSWSRSLDSAATFGDSFFAVRTRNAAPIESSSVALSHEREVLMGKTTFRAVEKRQAWFVGNVDSHVTAGFGLDASIYFQKPEEQYETLKKLSESLPQGTLEENQARASALLWYKKAIEDDRFEEVEVQLFEEIES